VERLWKDCEDLLDAVLAVLGVDRDWELGDAKVREEYEEREDTEEEVDTELGEDAVEAVEAVEAVDTEDGDRLEELLELGDLLEELLELRLVEFWELGLWELGVDAEDIRSSCTYREGSGASWSGRPAGLR
jgi:hypothetical protein